MNNSLHNDLTFFSNNTVFHFSPHLHVFLLFQVVYELPATSQWIFEVHWCPRNPAIISTASFDGHISMYSLLGGGARGGAEPNKEQKVCAHCFGGREGMCMGMEGESLEQVGVILIYG